MKYIVTGTQMRKADLYTIEKVGIPSLVLMERAALKVVETLETEHMDLSYVLVVCGSGNNGGDGYAIARLLHLKGYRVEICFVGKESSRSKENKLQDSIAKHYQIPIMNILAKNQYTVIIDAIFGTGLKRRVEGSYYTVIELLNQMPGRKVAVDIPSGIHDTTGQPMGIAFQADITVSFGFEKTGTVLYPGSDYAGKRIVADIGITEETIIQETNLTYSYEYHDFAEKFPKRVNDSHKGSYGKVLMITGSKEMAGAAYLSAKAAYKAGAGLVQIYTSQENRIILQQLLPEAIISTYQEFDLEKLKELIAWADMIAIGCGLGKSEIARQLVYHTLMSAPGICVMDADGINILSEHLEWLRETKAQIILTPHMKEMTRLLKCSMQELQQKRMEILHQFVREYPVVCVLKDARTLIAQRDKWTCLNQTGNAAMAKGGSGDVLTGIIAGIAAQHMNPYDAASIAVYLHGLAGDAAKKQKGLHSVLASDIIEFISEILKKI